MLMWNMPLALLHLEGNCMSFEGGRFVWQWCLSCFFSSRLLCLFSYFACVLRCCLIWSIGCRDSSPSQWHPGNNSTVTIVLSISIGFVTFIWLATMDPCWMTQILLCLSCIGWWTLKSEAEGCEDPRKDWIDTINKIQRKLACPEREHNSAVLTQKTNIYLAQCFFSMSQFKEQILHETTVIFVGWVCRRLIDWLNKA